MILYISGRMKGLKDYQDKFYIASKILSDKGHTVVNPAVLPQGLDTKSYMPICLAMLDACDGVVMIGNDWKESQGAMLEMQYAKYQGKIVYIDIRDVPKDIKGKYKREVDNADSN